MTDLPTRVYRVFLLNNDVQKRGDDVMVVENVIVGPSGVLECNRIWADTQIKTKIFYNGEFQVVEMDEHEIEEFHAPMDCEHGDE